MQNQIIQKSALFIKQLFKEKLSADFLFHNLAHTESVVHFSTLIGTQQNLSVDDLEVLNLAAWFHDTGYTELYQGHEDGSCRIARSFLEKQDYPEHKIKKVIECIDATRTSYLPKTKLQKIIKDADLSNLGMEACVDLSYKLRHEWEVICGNSFSDTEWLQNNLIFFNEHKFFTPEAKEMWKDGKKKNLKRMKALIKLAKEKEAREKTPIEGSKTTQMMFKTSLRNHIDLTGIADNKANMMLSINALIITIAMPLLAANIQGNRYLLLPSGILLLTCILSVIFATLATRPIKMIGNINMESLQKGNSNIFFFGNFYEMTLDQYRNAVNIVVKSETILEKSIVNDLYFLGKALGKKYSMLRTCYLIFMIGMTATVVAFVVSFLRSMN